MCNCRTAKQIFEMLALQILHSFYTHMKEKGNVFNPYQIFVLQSNDGKNLHFSLQPTFRATHETALLVYVYIKLIGRRITRKYRLVS